MRTLLLTILCTACGHGQPSEMTVNKVDSELEGIVSDFAEIAGHLAVYKVDSVLLGNPGEGRLGVCRYDGLQVGGRVYRGGRQVVVSSELPAEARRFVVYHELVHCALGSLGHDSRGLMAAEGSLPSVLQRDADRELQALVGR